ncbi:hypothetical protein AB0K00_43250 [Dactylosporangium sp. NPDC049525]|uniref:hypothetical protein n=1 Tax=Dactylosporangium sp. NPDC049525 TaxID=3154730 RepID=UPI00342A352E
MPLAPVALPEGIAVPLAGIHQQLAAAGGEVARSMSGSGSTGFVGRWVDSAAAATAIVLAQQHRARLLEEIASVQVTDAEIESTTDQVMTSIRTQLSRFARDVDH